MTLLFEPNFDGLIYLILAIMLSPALLLAFIALLVKKTNKKAAKVLFILAVVYTIVSLGICGGIML